MILETFVKGAIENNNYLLIDEQSKEAILIDCTEPANDIIEKIKEYSANLKYILITHGHFDHVLGLNYFKEKTNAKVFVPEDDANDIIDINSFLSKYNMPAVEIPKFDEKLKDGDEIDFGENKIKVIQTPGHTKGGVCYLIQDKLFSGDTIFYESIGRTDLPGGSFAEIKKSIREKVFTLPDDVKIYPGHGITTTVKHEKQNNNEL